MLLSSRKTVRKRCPWKPCRVFLCLLYSTRKTAHKRCLWESCRVFLCLLYSTRKTARKRCLLGALQGLPMSFLCYACSIPPVKQPVNAAFGSLLICLCRIWEDGSPQYSRECQQGSAHVFTAWHTRCRLDSDDAEQGQQYPPQGGKKQGVKGGAAPPCKIT